VQASYFSPRVLNRGEFTIPAGGGGGTRVGPITGLGGKCVDVAGANPANGTRVQLYTCDGGTAQRWTVGTDGTVRALGQCLDVSGGVDADGTGVQLWTCVAGNANQRWTANGSTLVNPATGRCLDATGQSGADRTPLQIWSCNGQANQDWTLPGSSARCARTVAPGERTLPVAFAGTTYQVTTYVPARAASTAPLVLNLHGSTGTGAGQLSYSDMKAAADRDGYLVVAPSGAIPSGGGYVWNVPGVGAPPAGARDDVAFLDQVVATLAGPLCADTTRVYGTGYSGGGRMISAYAWRGRRHRPGGGPAGRAPRPAGHRSPGNPVLPTGSRCARDRVPRAAGRHEPVRGRRQRRVAVLRTRGAAAVGGHRRLRREPDHRQGLRAREPVHLHRLRERRGGRPALGLRRRSHVARRAGRVRRERHHHAGDLRQHPDVAVLPALLPPLTGAAYTANPDLGGRGGCGQW
jgi:poly(3-hydroxybutyrate) depolymerase